MILWALLGCQCGDAPPPPIPAHYPDFGALVDAAARGDVATARTIADGLRSAEDDGDPGEAIAAAAGFLRVAEDADDVAAATVRVARACGRCHGSAVPPVVSVTGHAVARAAVHPLVWPAATFEPPSADDAPSRAIRAALDAPPSDTAAEPANPARRVLGACQACHAT